jgi:hypothetical protein
VEKGGKYPSRYKVDVYAVKKKNTGSVGGADVQVVVLFLENNNNNNNSTDIC